MTQRQMPMPVDPAELRAIEERLASAKQQNDQMQADLRVARAAATAAQKELVTALQGWYATHPGGSAPEYDDDEEE